MDKFKGRIPETIEEGKKLFPHFQEAHLKRRLAFIPPEDCQVKTALATWGRSGSNFIKFYMEEVEPSLVWL